MLKSRTTSVRPFAIATGMSWLLVCVQPWATRQISGAMDAVPVRAAQNNGDVHDVTLFRIACYGVIYHIGKLGVGGQQLQLQRIGLALFTNE